MSTHHVVPPEPEMMVWGYFDGSLDPILQVKSGDTVTVSSWPAAGEECLPPDPSLVHPLHRRALSELKNELGAHFVTGPIAVEGAMPGDVLQVDILDHQFLIDWGFTSIIPLLGTLPEFDTPKTIHPHIDRQRGYCSLPWGKDLKLDPFFGIIATSPPRHWGRLATTQPRAFGGNMDNKELRPGTTLYLPVFVEGANFMAGDGHGVQGDGEVCITALETALSGTFRLTVRKDLSFDAPFAENETHLISIGLNEDLDDAAADAVRRMIKEIGRRSGLSPEDAYMLCSLAGDLRVTQTVDMVKGCHMMMAKTHLP